MGVKITDSVPDAVPGKSYTRNYVQFGRIFGESEAFGLLGRQDYVFLVEHKHEPPKGSKLLTITYDIKVWKNKGVGATKLKADGNKYCNMMGHDNGMVDYVWVRSTGEMTLYPNKGLPSISSDGTSFWGPSALIFDPKLSVLNPGGTPRDRRDLHLADWDGDGTCDIIWVDPNNQNRLQVWRNNYKNTNSWDDAWEHLDNPAPQVYCPETRGVGIFDLPVQFADITGNKRADYLCLEKDGRTWGWVQGDDGSFEYIDQVKYSEQKDRANLHWADVNGDGKDDLIWTDKFNGDGWVWYNNGRKDVKGSRFEWVPAGPSYMGNHAGSCMYYPDLNGDHRADMHSIMYTFTNQAETWFNTCGRDNQGDDGPLTDPGLPVQPGSDEDWRSITCSDPNVADATGIAAVTRWRNLRAPAAWDAAIQGWKYNQTHRTDLASFSREVSGSSYPPLILSVMLTRHEISNFFHGPDDMDCQSLNGDNGCMSAVLLTCDQVVGGVGGWLILNSFYRIDGVSQ
jgi:hypothetical protein